MKLYILGKICFEEENGDPYGIEPQKIFLTAGEMQDEFIHKWEKDQLYDFSCHVYDTYTKTMTRLYYGADDYWLEDETTLTKASEEKIDNLLSI